MLNFKLKKFAEKNISRTKLVKASDEFVRNLFIHDQIKSSSNILGFRKRLYSTHPFLHKWKI